MPAIILASILLPVLFDAVTQGKMHHGRSAFDYLNPVLVIDRYHSRPGQVMNVAAVLAAIWGILSIIDMKRIAGSVSEVFAASRERRARGAG
ncbi:MAG: hypothetical protein GY704_16150 [Phycisphaeraceae bacterium]|nr:hypothetical protein [Phycisphaeraceae bacterium]